MQRIQSPEPTRGWFSQSTDHSPLQTLRAFALVAPAVPPAWQSPLALAWSLLIPEAGQGLCGQMITESWLCSR